MLVLAMTLVMLPITAQAATDGYYTYTVKDGMATITNVDQNIGGAVVIPDKFIVEGIGEYPVVAIESEAFNYCQGITSIVIPDGITTIEYGTFRMCTQLSSVTIPNTVTTICPGAFANTALTSVIIPESVEIIESSAFEYCTSLTHIELPSNIKSIGGSIFAGCSSLTQITIPGSLSEIPDSCFSNCTSLSDVTIENGVEIIGGSAFAHCSSLEEINLPESVTEIQGAFYSSGLKSFQFPENVTTIELSTFNDCDNLTEFVVPYTVSSIGDYAFAYCDNLKQITIFDSVGNIRDDAFYGCNENLIIQCFDESAAEKYAEENGFICKYITRDLDSTATGIQISTASDSYHKNNTTFTAYILNQTIEEITDDHTVYSMEYCVDGIPSSQEHEMTFTVPVPQGYNGQSCKVYLIENGQKTEEINTNYLSDEKMLQFSVANPNGTFAIVNGSLPGDANNDKAVDFKDVSILLRSLAGWDVNPNLDASNVNADERVDFKDVSVLLKYLGGYPVEFK